MDFGQLLELDDFSGLFNGVRKDFYLTRTIFNEEFYSIVAEAGSGIILQNNLLMFVNDVLQNQVLIIHLLAVQNSLS